MVRRDLKFDEQKVMRVSLERELQLQAMEELLVPKEEEPQTDVEQPHAEVLGVERSNQEDSSKDGQKSTQEANRLLLDVRENVREPTSQRRKRRSLERYTGYMALVGECVETEPSSFEEAMQQPIWVDAMVEEYDSIVRNNVWDVVPRPKNKSVVSSRWLYKQAPRAWYTRIDNYITRLGFTKSEVDANLYHITVKGKPLIIVLYVDDFILTGDDQLIMSCKEDLAREFKMKDMGRMHYFLGMEVWQKDGELFVSQGKYANEILRRFHMEKYKPMQTPLKGN
eukprot:PITA_18182